MKRVVGIVQARVGSTRFPGKVLAKLDGLPLLQHVIRRVKQCQALDEVVVATTRLPEEKALLPICEAEGVRLFAPPLIEPHDVLARFAWVAAITEADGILRVTADCPLWDPAVGVYVVGRMENGGFEYVTNDTTMSGWPDGHDAQAFTVGALQRAHEEATDPQDREHVCPWMAQHCLSLMVMKPRWWKAVPTQKISVDTPEDLERVRAIYQQQEVSRWQRFSKTERNSRQ